MSRKECIENEYGCCPVVCGMNDGYLNIGEEHCFYCREHKKKWLFGSGWFEPIRSVGGWHRQRADLKEARILNASVHNLRHTFATHTIKRGTKLEVVRRALGA